METDLRKLMREAHETSRSKGWWDEPVPDFGTKMALLHSEVSEAFEEYRRTGLHRDYLLYVEADCGHLGMNPLPPKPGDGQKPEGVASELADVVIRVLDTCEGLGIPLLEALEAKMAYNKTRPHRHGGKNC